MAYWLLKSEPTVWSWDNQVKKGVTFWDGVRNYQANNNLKAMKIGDLALFYHSGDEKQIMGVVEIVRTYYPDLADPSERFGMVDVKSVKPFPRPVPLKTIKEDSRLQQLALVRQSRLSVMPIDKRSWDILTKMGEYK